MLMIQRLTRLATALALLLMVCTRPALSQTLDTETVNGYAEWSRGDIIIVEGQRVRVHATTRFDGDGVLDPLRIPLGYEVEATGIRLSDGSLLAEEMTAKPNGSALFEAELRRAAENREAAWRNAGRMNLAASDGLSLGGPIITSGPQVERVRRVMSRLMPSYLSASAARVYVVQSHVWNAFMSPNGAAWVFTGLLYDVKNDDELAVVLGHELAHFTHEHSRRKFRQLLFRQLVAAGTQAAVNAIDNDAGSVWASYGAKLALTAWRNGYGRDLEDQADKVGLRYAFEAGYDVARGPLVWQRVRDRQGERNRVDNFFFGSHSRPTDRIRNLNAELTLNYGVGAPPPRQNTAVRAAASSTPIRQEPTPEGAVLVTVEKGTGVEVLNREGDWYQVTVRDDDDLIVGYARMQLLDGAPRSVSERAPRRVDQGRVPDREIAQVLARRPIAGRARIPGIETSLDVVFTDQFGIRFGVDFPTLFKDGQSASTFRFTIGVTFRSAFRS